MRVPSEEEVDRSTRVVISINCCFKKRGAVDEYGFSGGVEPFFGQALDEEDEVWGEVVGRLEGDLAVFDGVRGSGSKDEPEEVELGATEEELEEA